MHQFRCNHYQSLYTKQDNYNFAHRIALRANFTIPASYYSCAYVTCVTRKMIVINWSAQVHACIWLYAKLVIVYCTLQSVVVMQHPSYLALCFQVMSQHWNWKEI